MTVLLARNRQPHPTVAAGAHHAELAAELITLPSGLLAMVCEAIVRLKVRAAGVVGACVCVAGCPSDERGPKRPRRVQRGRGSARLFRDGRTACGVWEVLLVVPYRMLFRCPMWSQSSCVAVQTAGERQRLKVPRACEAIVRLKVLLLCACWRACTSV